MNKELIAALDVLEKEKGISKESLFEAIESNLVVAYKNNFNKADNVSVTMDRETGEFHIYSQKTVVEEVTDKVSQISLEDARKIKASYDLGDTVNVEIQSKDFGRIATQSAKNGILQKIREEERKSLYEQYYEKQNDVITGVVALTISPLTTLPQSLSGSCSDFSSSPPIKGIMFPTISGQSLNVFPAPEIA